MNKMLFSKDHIWLQESGGITALGITDYAQKKLASVLYISLPDIGEKLKAGERFGDIESVKTVSDLISPVDGVVTDINEILVDEPELISESPYEAWIVKIRTEKLPDELMDETGYKAYTRTL